MAKNYRTIKFTYNSTTTEIDVRTATEAVTRNEIYGVQTAIDGTPYKNKTGENITFTYNFAFCDSFVFDFFNDIYAINETGTAVTMDREEDDGTFTTYSTAIINQPQYNDYSIDNTTDQKVYQNVTVEVIVK